MTAASECPCPYGCGKMLSPKGMAMHVRYCPNAPMTFPGRPGGYGKCSTCLAILVLLFIAPKTAWDAIQAAIAGTTFAVNVGSKASSHGLEGLRLGIDSWRPADDDTAETYFDNKFEFISDKTNDIRKTAECSMVKDPEDRKKAECPPLD